MTRTNKSISIHLEAAHLWELFETAAKNATGLTERPEGYCHQSYQAREDAYIEEQWRHHWGHILYGSMAGDFNARRNRPSFLTTIALIIYAVCTVLYLKYCRHAVLARFRIFHTHYESSYMLMSWPPQVYIAIAFSSEQLTCYFRKSD